MSNLVYLSLGTNLGDKIHNLDFALVALKKFVKINNISSLYETEPVNVEKQENFINIAIEISTHLSPSDLLVHTQQIEFQMGRKESEVGKPRTIDIDIIFFNSMIYKQPEIQIPHPRAHKRAFVIIPIMEISPGLIHPVLNKSIEEISKNLVDQKVAKLENRNIEKIK